MKKSFRTYLADALAGKGAHISFDQAVENFPMDRTGEKPPNLDHNAWMLVWHLRLCQDDIINYCTDPGSYRSLEYPGGYWPDSPSPPSEGAWQGEIAGFRNGIGILRSWALDEKLDLFTPLPGTPGHNLAREMMIIIAHNGYHIGQLVDLRMLLRIPVKDW